MDQKVRIEGEAAEPSVEELLRRTSGLWSSGDGLDAQLRLRDEWEAKDH